MKKNLSALTEIKSSKINANHKIFLIPTRLFCTKIESNKRKELFDMTTSKSAGVPRPLVRTNQFIIVISCIIAVTTGFYWILFLPLLAGLSGIFLGKNFVIATARHFLKKAPSDYIQEDKSDLRFNQIIASSLLALSLLAHFTGFSVLAIVAASIVFLGAAIAISGFCVGCWLHFQIHQWQYRRKLKKS